MYDPKPRPNRDRYLSILRRMTPQQKLEKMFELNEMGHQLVRAGIRQREPHLSNDEVNRRAVEKTLQCHNRNY